MHGICALQQHVSRLPAAEKTMEGTSVLPCKAVCTRRAHESSLSYFDPDQAAKSSAMRASAVSHNAFSNLKTETILIRAGTDMNLTVKPSSC